MPQRKATPAVERLKIQHVQRSPLQQAGGIESAVTPTTAGQRGGVGEQVGGAGGVQGALSHRSGNLSSRLTTTLLTARGLISALHTARRRRSTSVTPADVALPPPPKPHAWKLLLSQRNQLSDLYHHHHDLARSFWGIYELVHEANISVSPPMLQEALLGVGVPIPQNEDDMFLSEHQFLLLVEGIMTDVRHLDTYYEDDQKLVELALRSVPPACDAPDNAASPQQTPSTSALLSARMPTDAQQHDALEDSGRGMRVPVSALTRLLMRYNISAPSTGGKQQHRDDGGGTPSAVGLATPNRHSNDTPAFVASVLNELAPSRKPTNHRKSIMARSSSLASAGGADVPDHIPLDFLCNALNRATIATPDPLQDYRASSGAAGHNNPSRTGNNAAGACGAIGAFSVSRPRGLSMQQRSAAQQQCEREASPSVTGISAFGASPLGTATTGGKSPQSSPSAMGLVPDASYAFSAAGAASQFSLDMNASALHQHASSPHRGHHAAASGSPSAAPPSPVRHKMISATAVTVPVPPSKRSNAAPLLKRHDSLDTLLKATLQQCTEATNVVLESAAQAAAAARGRGGAVGRGGRGAALSKGDKRRFPSTGCAGDDVEWGRDSGDDEDGSDEDGLDSFDSPVDADATHAAFGTFRFGGSSGTFASADPSGVFQRTGTSSYIGLPPLAAVRRSLPLPSHQGEASSSPTGVHGPSRPSPLAAGSPDASPNTSPAAAVTKYRKPWLEPVDRSKPQPASSNLAEAAAVVGMKESHRMPMDVLLREVSALTADDRRALTPHTRRLVTIARSATSLGFDEHAHRLQQADAMHNVDKHSGGGGGGGGRQKVAVGAQCAVGSTNADAAVPPPSGTAADEAPLTDGAPWLPKLPQNLNQRATGAMQWERWTSGGASVPGGHGGTGVAEKQKLKQKTRKKK